MARSIEALPRENRVDRVGVYKLAERLVLLHGHQREASRLLSRLATAAEGSWGNLEEAADRSLTAARTVADSLLKSLRRAARGEPPPGRVPLNGG